jgi:hypothetical protein
MQRAMSMMKPQDHDYERLEWLFVMLGTRCRRCPEMARTRRRDVCYPVAVGGKAEV